MRSRKSAQNLLNRTKNNLVTPVGPACMSGSQDAGSRTTTKGAGGPLPQRNRDKRKGDPSAFNLACDSSKEKKKKQDCKG